MFPAAGPWSVILYGTKEVYDHLVSTVLKQTACNMLFIDGATKNIKFSCVGFNQSLDPQAGDSHLFTTNDPASLILHTAREESGGGPVLFLLHIVLIYLLEYHWREENKTFVHVELNKCIYLRLCLFYHNLILVLMDEKNMDPERII